MAQMQWDDSMSIGHGEIDGQHKTLLVLLNDLDAAVAAGAGRDEAGQALRRLCDYTVDHFAAEEAIMDLDAYPEYDLHVAEHMDCTDKALEFLQAFDSGQDLDLKAFLDFVAQWVVSHILKVDKTLGAFLAGRGAAQA